MGVPKILVLENEPHINYMLCYKLREAGAETVSGRDGKEGLELVARESPDVVVADCQMPLMGGAEFAKALAGDGVFGGVPVILLTARGERVLKGALAGTQVRFVLSQPFSARDLLERIGEILPAWGLAAGGLRV